MWWGCLFFALAAFVVGAVGLIGVTATAKFVEHIVGDELAAQRVVTALREDSNNIQLVSQGLALADSRAQREELSGLLYDVYMPSAEAHLIDLRRILLSNHPDGEKDLAPTNERWSTLRSLINSNRAGAGEPVAPAVVAEVATACASFNAELTALAEQEQADAATNRAAADQVRRHSVIAVAISVGMAVAGSAAFGWFAKLRFRRAAEPGRRQAEFNQAMQLAATEEEAQTLLQRHLERSVPSSSVAVLNRNNSADRLEAVTALPPNSPLRTSLEHAEPQSCLAVRSGSTHEQTSQALLSCSVCGPCLGRSICTPLTVGSEVIGAVLVSRSAAYQSVDRQRVRESVSQSAPVLANLRNLALAEQRAATDSLTGLPNKRATADTIKRMLAAASRTLTPLCLVMLDLDHFRSINERFGHPVGDQALANVGAALRSTLRESDFAGRNGGEEFVIVLPDTDLTGGVQTAERVRAAISQIMLPGVDLVVTASLGVAVYPEHATSAERLERSADSALYVAKRSGRNRVEVATPPPRIRPDDETDTAMNGSASVRVGA